MIGFSGDWATTCRLLDGPVDVLNVMTLRGRVAYKFKIERAGPDQVAEQIGATTRLIYCMEGELRVCTGETPAWSVKAQETLRLEVGHPTNFSLVGVQGRTTYAALDLCRVSKGSGANALG